MFKNRQVVLNSYNEACKQTQKQLQYLESLKMSSSISSDSVNQAINELTQTKANEEAERKRFAECSDKLRPEMETFEQYFEKDMMYWMDAYAKHQVGVNDQLLKLLSTINV